MTDWPSTCRFEIDENPKSAEGLNVGPVVFLAQGPVDPGADWLNVLLPIRPNGTTGWVRRSDVTLTANQFRIEVHLGKGEEGTVDASLTVQESASGTSYSHWHQFVRVWYDKP